MVKDERHLDRFDRAFAAAFKGLEAISDDQLLQALDLPADWLAKAGRKAPDSRRTRRHPGAWRLRQADGDIAKAAGGTEGPPPGRHRNGSAPPAPRPSAPMATTPKGCGSGRTKAATSAPSRSGTGASSAILTTGSRSAPATSRSPCAPCANGRATGRMKSWTLTAPSAPPPSMAGWTCRPGPNAAMRLRCCFSSTSAAAWTRMSR